MACVRRRASKGALRKADARQYTSSSKKSFGTGRMTSELSTTRNPSGNQLDAILAEIARHACDPDFSALAVAAKLGLSDRYIRQLLRRTGKTFSQHKAELRLDCARRLLVREETAHLSITEVALMSGFNNVSHFNRCFRNRFGETPSKARRGTEL
jgi:AraC-like DNA-binding protein